MDFTLTTDQSVLLDGLRSACAPFREVPDQHRRSFCHFSTELQDILRNAGYTNPLHNGLSPIDAALIVYEAAKLPVVVELGFSGLVVPHLTSDIIEGPIAIISGDPLKAHRLLDQASNVLVETGDDVVLLPCDALDVKAVEAIFAYPYGRLEAAPDLSKGVSLGGSAKANLTQWRRITLALEIAAAADAAIAFTSDYIKQRFVFGRPIGSFQAVRHRMAQCLVIARGLKLMALQAAWSGNPLDANLASSYAQQHVHKLVFDLHQFNGGMGLTNEQMLHLWTYRLRALQSEVGGTNSSASAAAELLWSKKAS